MALAHVQAHTYEGKGPAVPVPTAHVIMEALAGVSSNMEEYVVFCGLARHMLHPQTGCRATIMEVLKSQLFAVFSAVFQILTDAVLLSCSCMQAFSP